MDKRFREMSPEDILSHPNFGCLASALVFLTVKKETQSSYVSRCRKLGEVVNQVSAERLRKLGSKRVKVSDLTSKDDQRVMV